MEGARSSAHRRWKLRGFALRPTPRPASQRRCDGLRAEIEGNSSIAASEGLWAGEDFAFVAETKARTVALRHRTIELLRKSDAYACGMGVEEGKEEEDQKTGSVKEEGRPGTIAAGDAAAAGAQGPKRCLSSLRAALASKIEQLVEGYCPPGEEVKKLAILPPLAVGRRAAQSWSPPLLPASQDGEPPCCGGPAASPPPLATPPPPRHLLPQGLLQRSHTLDLGKGLEAIADEWPPHGLCTPLSRDQVQPLIESTTEKELHDDVEQHFDPLPRSGPEPTSSSRGSLDPCSAHTSLATSALKSAQIPEDSLPRRKSNAHRTTVSFEDDAFENEGRDLEHAGGDKEAGECRAAVEREAATGGSDGSKGEECLPGDQPKTSRRKNSVGYRRKTPLAWKLSSRCTILPSQVLNQSLSGLPEGAADDREHEASPPVAPPLSVGTGRGGDGTCRRPSRRFSISGFSELSGRKKSVGPDNFVEFIERHQHKTSFCGNLVYQDRRVIAGDPSQIETALWIRHEHEAKPLLIETIRERHDVARMIDPNQLQDILAWGQKQHLSSQGQWQAIYEWLCSLVTLRKDEHGELSLALAGYDTDRIQTDGGEPISALRKDLHELFQEKRNTLQRISMVRDALNDRTVPEQSFWEKRKAREIQAVSQRFKLYESTAEAIYDWYLRLHVSDDHPREEEWRKEWAAFLGRVAEPVARSIMDEGQVWRMWKDLRASADYVTFPRFVEWLALKFQKISALTAWEVNGTAATLSPEWRAPAMRQSLPFSPKAPPAPELQMSRPRGQTIESLGLLVQKRPASLGGGGSATAAGVF